jgi:hypothetical protein
MRQTGVNTKTARRVLAFFRAVKDRQQKVEPSSFFIQDLPTALKTQVVVSATEGLLASLDIFRGCPAALLSTLHAKLIPHAVSSGFDLEKEQSINNSIFIVQDGQLVVLHNDRLEEVIEGPTVVGLTAFLSDVVPEWRTRPRGFQALNVVTAWELRIADIIPALEGNPGYHADLLRRVRDDLQAYFKERFDLYEDDLLDLERRDAEVNDAIKTLQDAAEIKKSKRSSAAARWSTVRRISRVVSSPRAEPGAETAGTETAGGGNGEGGGGGDLEFTGGLEGGSARTASVSSQARSSNHHNLNHHHNNNGSSMGGDSVRSESAMGRLFERTVSRLQSRSQQEMEAEVGVEEVAPGGNETREGRERYEGTRRDDDGRDGEP